VQEAVEAGTEGGAEGHAVTVDHNSLNGKDHYRSEEIGGMPFGECWGEITIKGGRRDGGVES